MLFDPYDAHVPSAFLVKLADAGWERREAAALRRAVFCHEQGVFAGDDRDAIDAADGLAHTIVALSCVAGQPDQVVGTVRIHEWPDAPRTWTGSRLAVHAAFRRHGHLGSALIRAAVGTANARGCDRFMAQVQAQNVELFQKLNWRLLDRIEVHGRPHGVMQAGLAHYPPIADPLTGFVVTAARRARRTEAA
ncbi:MAG: GNAT family N-acetyltransferase [Aquabacterium sp.]|jgi:putative N-acetyltransferase (TIGR04045 family)|nr:MAG: GNAT family N-acetyltransferase [Aquabacterium sp.]